MPRSRTMAGSCREFAGILDVCLLAGSARCSSAGREAESGVLEGALEAAAGGMPRVVLVGAEAGGGKSRLVTEFAARVRDRALVLAGGMHRPGCGRLAVRAVHGCAAGARPGAGGRRAYGVAAWQQCRGAGGAGAGTRITAAWR